MAESDDIQETTGRHSKYVLIRYFIVLALLLPIAVGIVFCIIDIALVDRNIWLEIADKERTKIPDRIIVPNRGNIYSFDGRLMATSFPRYRILMDFRGEAIDTSAFYQQIKTKKGEKPDSAAIKASKENGVDSLAFYLSKKFNKDENTVKRQLKDAVKRKERRYIIHNRRISFADLQEIRQFPFIRLGNNKSGFIAEEFVERQRPFGTLASRTIGNTYATLDSQKLTQGSNGLELEYDSILRGKPGLNAIRREAGVWRGIPIIEAENGMDIRSTIDVEIQDIAERALLNELRKTNAESGTIILMEVKTGEIKAITNMGRTATGYVEDRNRAVADLLEPGSTFKTASIMVAIEDGVCQPGDMVETGDGIYDYLKNGKPIRDHNANKGGYGSISVEESIWHSSNVGVAKIILKGYENNPMAFIDGLARIGLMEDLHIGISGAGRPIFRTPADAKWSKGSLPWMSFGYETQIPPVYTLAFYNAIANNGKMMRPIFAREIMRDGKTIERFSPEVVKESICSARTLRIIRDMLLGVVENGTGHPAYSPIIRIAGKTGTAQISEAGVYAGMGHQVSFAGYFPADQPVYSCIAVIRRPSPSFYPSGGAMSGSVIKNVAEKIYAAHTRWSVRELPVDSSAINLPAIKAGEGKALRQVLNKLDIDLDRKEVKSPWVLASASDEKVRLNDINIQEGLVPRVIGMGAKDAVYLLENAGLQVNLSGVGRVTSQSILPGQKVIKGRTITIILK
ncbi:MAG: transpeptidase family protein [Tannerellaceae bacterium]|jgi:cell division protein FtsI (penicillin-binding protein 3)|nr:transpeptidase family protein [Tannerellaceae bacterium]